MEIPPVSSIPKVTDRSYTVERVNKVAGGDYKVDEIVGHDLAPVHIIPTVEGYSTTNIIGDINGS